ncbi:MAG: peptide ABC transporter substrate-binding protein [Chloroflexi bacterium HGW-Chloroflexi-10]|nr:MAG: peptide ABC transporter substrate-binding protein [Chloroflexi bacterium HGW-Chloroflexi-10]
MKSRTLFSVVFVLVLLSMLVVACQPATPAPAADATMAPEVVENATAVPAEVVPTDAPAEPMEKLYEEVAFEPMVLTSPDCEYGGLIKEIASLDESTVQFTMCVPDPAFPSKAAFSAFAIQPREWIEYAMESREILEHPVGTGPYVLDSWNRGDSIVFKKFADYWGEPAKTDTLVFRWSTEGAARLLELQTGTVDGIDNPSPDDFPVIQDNPDLTLFERQAINIFYVGMTNTFEHFKDVKVRQAIAMGIDRQRLVDNFYPAGSEVASHFTPCAVPNGCTGDDWYEYDPEAAKALLSEAGYPDGFDTTIFYRDVFRSYLPEPGLVATDLQAQLAEIGINAEIVVMETGAFIEESSAGRLDGIYLLGWNADYPHITNFLDYHFTASNPQFGTTFPEIYEKLAAAAQLADPVEAEPLYVEANNAIKELVPMVPIAHGGSGTAFRADVEGAHASPLGNEYMAVMDPGGRDTMVWMQNAEPISLYCNDETDGESLRPCEQVLESLLSYTVAGTEVEPGLATSCDPNDDLTVWTCNLREGVKFHDGSMLDATDVAMSWIVAWDASNPLHIGNTGAFEYFTYLWGNLLNAE